MYQVDEDIIKAAKETYDLETMLGLNEDALEKALSSALSAYEPKISARIIAGIRAYADEMKNEGAEPEEFAPLYAVALELEYALPAKVPDYSPVDGDIVTVALTGEFRVYEDDCSEKHESYSVQDRNTGQEYYFEKRDIPKLDIRIISRDGFELP